MKITETMTAPEMFGGHFNGESWDRWRHLLAGFYGDETDPETFKYLTNREPPTEEASELWLVVGRRGGKSNIAALLAVYEAVFRDHRAQLAPGEIATVMVIAADRKQARSVMRYIKGLLLDNPILTQMVTRVTEESIELANRCNIEIMTATFRATRGYTVAAAILDEIAFWHSEGANPDTEILRALRPSLATLGGKLIALSSPYARRGVLWNNYHRYFGKDSQVLVAQAPTLYMNPKLPPEIVQEAKQEDPVAAAAEYDAQFRTDVETFVSYEVVDMCTRPDHIELLPAPGISYSAFVDPSGGSADAMTMAIAHLDKKTNTVIIDATRTVKPPFSPESVVGEFCELLETYGIRKVHGDAYAGEWPREQFRKRAVSYHKSEMNKSELYQALLPLLNSGKIEIPPDEQLRRELLGLERRTSRAGRDSIDHLPGAHDDLANAVAGVASIAKKPRQAFKIDIGFVF